MTRRTSAIVAIALSIAMLLGACGDDATPSADNDDAGQGADERSGFTVTVTADAIEMPDEVTGGVVRVQLESDLEEADVNFTKVAAGTAEDQFKQAIVGVIGGGPIPEFIQETTGILGYESGKGGESTLVLPEGDYIAWTIPEDPRDEDAEGEGSDAEAAQDAPAEEGEEGGPGGGGPPPEAVVTKTFTATPGEPADLPDLDGNEIVARDYTFDVKVKAGAEEFVFRNEGPDQLHHVVLFNFGDVEPDVVEENLPGFLEAGEDSPPPPAFKDVDFENISAGDSTVLTPGLAATTKAKGLESGSTYAAVCFISDRTGGPPHAFAHGMRTVFTVE